MVSIRGQQMETDPLRELLDKVNRLESEVRELRAGRRLEAAAIGAGGLRVQAGGSVTVDDGGDLVIAGGEFRARNSEGLEQMYVGPLSYSGVPAGTGFIFRRFNGGQFFTLEGSDPDNQFFALRDEQGNIVISDDAATGQGLARPWLPVTWAGSDFTQWPGTTSGSFSAVLETAVPRQQPRIFVRVRHTSDLSGTTGEVRLMCNGTQLGSTTSVGFVIGATDFGPVALPDAAFGATLGLSVDARRTAGTGAIRAMVTASWTQQS